jgi:hypothetical protein
MSEEINSCSCGGLVATEVKVTAPNELYFIIFCHGCDKFKKRRLCKYHFTFMDMGIMQSEVIHDWNKNQPQSGE